MGLNLSANNAFLSLLVNYVFYKDAFAAKLLRVLGVIMALSSILILLDMSTYCIYINILIILILTFFSIRGRNKALIEKMSARDRLLKEYEREIKEKRMKLEALKNRVASKDIERKANGKSIHDIKKKMWDDGSMSQRDIINGLKDKK
jgi:hypothetical protein